MGASDLLVGSQVERFALGPGARVLQFASLSFDAAVSEIATVLSTGAGLVLSGRERSGEVLARLFGLHEITHATLPPAVLSGLPEVVGLETLVVAGESCSAELVAGWCAGRRMINAYGPTETTVCASMSEALAGGGLAPLGRPIWNTRVYVLDGGLSRLSLRECGGSFTLRGVVLRAGTWVVRV